MNNLRTGDLLLFKGRGVFSRLITALPGSDYSHVGMYVSLLNDYVFESTSLGTLPDIMTGEPINGVQVTRFEDRVRSYDGEVFVRPVMGSRSQDQKNELRSFIHRHHGKPYEQSNWELASAELDIMPWHKNKPDDSSLFCSETVCMALRAMGLMPEGLAANEFTPSDFSGDIELCEGYQWGDVSPLVVPDLNQQKRA